MASVGKRAKISEEQPDSLRNSHGYDRRPILSDSGEGILEVLCFEDDGQQTCEDS